MVVGASIGLYAARTVQMTQMPELVALMHSMVGLAAMLVGFANYIDTRPHSPMSGVEKTIHEARDLHRHPDRRGDLFRLGDRLRQAVRQDRSGNPLLLPARHWINLPAC
jgi:NAD(P) transhydrogenase subunit beta